MNEFFNLPVEVLDSLSEENMAMVIGGLGGNHEPEEVNQGTGCNCNIVQK